MPATSNQQITADVQIAVLREKLETMAQMLRECSDREANARTDLRIVSERAQRSEKLAVERSAEISALRAEVESLKAVQPQSKEPPAA